MRADMTSDEADLSLQIANKIAPLLAGHSAAVQSAILADLLARWVAGWEPRARRAALVMHVDLVRRLVEPNERALFGEAGHPGGRQ